MLWFPPVQAQRNIQLQLETHNQYINQLLASRSSELLRSVSAASSARAAGGGGRAGGAGDGGSCGEGLAAPCLASPRPGSAHALSASGPSPQQLLVQTSAVLQHPLRGSRTHATLWNGHAALTGLDAGELGRVIRQLSDFRHDSNCWSPVILSTA